MSKSTFPAAIITTDGEVSGILVHVNEQVVDLYGAIAVWEMIESHPWVVEQDLPVVIAWNLDDDPKAYSEHNDLMDFVTASSLNEIPWNYQLTLTWNEKEYDEDEEEDDEEDEEYDEDEEEEDEEDEEEE